MTARPLTHLTILRFWLPLASTWLMMAIEGPYLAALIARLADPTVNLAAFGVAFAFAIIIEAPVIMLLAASTALVEDRQSYLALRRFSYGLSAALTLAQLAVLAPPVFDALSRDLLALPPDVAQLTHGALAWLLPWTAAIGYRRFRQGLLIRRNLTRRVAYGTIVRLVAMSLTALLAYRFLPLAGAHVGALALSVGVVAEAVASRRMTAGLVGELQQRQLPAEGNSSLRLGTIVSFYMPLALTSVLAMAVQPMVTFFMGQSRYALESLAVLPVVHGLTFIFRAIGLSYLEVVVALLGDRREQVTAIFTFGVCVGLGAVTGLGLIAFTPMASVWFRDISGLTPELAAIALPPVRILAVFPGLSVLLAMQRGLLVHAHWTRPITWSTLGEVTVVGVMLTVGIHELDLVGATAAAVAVLSGRVVGNLWLITPCLEVVRSANTVDAPAAPPAAAAEPGARR